MRRALILLPFLAACVAPEASVPDVSTRHFASTESAGNGARWHIFLFDPSAPRDLDTRIALARRAIEADPACRWIGASRAEIATRTAEQGERYAESVLAAPVRCDTRRA
ncbi:hypothetical protein [Palleronia abyssalis]|uniref:Lipoprotein n=1 Tax=Palleronia abyssalis TaxID=1501240 RepID=A0A2R8C1I6_9RHOB|nr:hypothetical protein [Palleronia abyssalis]SPJ26287.1 hypothetical protein PAA8504_04144 [Palleronia abyssalis]